MHVGFLLQYVALASIPIAYADSASLACGKVSSQLSAVLDEEPASPKAKEGGSGSS
jgi:hypothetical protein